MLETLDYTIRIGSTPTILYFDLCLYSAYAAHYVYNISLKIRLYTLTKKYNTATSQSATSFSDICLVLIQYLFSTYYVYEIYRLRQY